MSAGIFVRLSKVLHLREYENLADLVANSDSANLLMLSLCALRWYKG